MAEEPGKIREWREVDVAVFESEIVPRNQPAVLKAALTHWPAVRNGLESPAAIVAYIKQFDTGQLANAIIAPPSINGRFFYTDDLQGFNFERKRVAVSTVLENLVSMIEKPGVPAIAMQAIPVAELLPGFQDSNPLSLLPPQVQPRMWLGNRAMTAAHYDMYDNIACVVAGRRRFTLFPPEQIRNLYIGPLLNTPGGSPISMVDLRNPDLSRFPRFSEALSAASEAHLEPGDAIYIPYLWWHAVESIDNVNVLMNYWWNDAETDPSSPFYSLLHSMLSISELSDRQRDAWRAFYDYFVFQADFDPAGHLPADLQDVLGSLSPEKQRQLKAWLSQQLNS